MIYRSLLTLILPIAFGAATAVAAPGSPKTSESVSLFTNYHDAFKLPHEPSQYDVLLIEQSSPGNVFVEGEAPRLVFQIQAKSGQPIRGEATVALVRYGMRHVPGDWWVPRIENLGETWSTRVHLDIPAGGYQDVTVEPNLPASFGGYAVLFDLGEHGRAYGTSLVRVMKPDGLRVQYGHQAMEALPAPILSRLGYNAVGRYSVAYLMPEDPARTSQLEELGNELKEYHEHGVTVVLEFGASSRVGPHLPLSLARPHLDEDGVMQKGKSDFVWLPAYDADFKQYVYDLVSEYGWPKGPVTGVKLWNEPWEARSISGWQSDMLRYRELYRLMGDAVLEARERAEVEVLIGGADSSSNTWDKLFPEGLEKSPFWPKYFDFVSVHYQGLNAPVLYPEWNQRKYYQGRVKVWDTESWIANADDIYVSAVAANRAAGYDRTMGTLARYGISVLSHHRVARDRVMTPRGNEQRERLLEARPLAASYAAVQKLIGERPFERTVFRHGLPYVFLFGALDEQHPPTAVVVGNLDIFDKQPSAFADIKPLNPDEPPTITLDAQVVRVLDFYGNPIEPVGDSYTIPLTAQGYFVVLAPGVNASVEQMAQTFLAARVDGFEPVNIEAQDMTSPIDTRPTLRVKLTNQLEREVSGQLDVTIPGLTLQYDAKINLTPREEKIVKVKVGGGEAKPSNQYPMTITFDAGRHGVARHQETMRVNWIARKDIVVDGELAEWAGVLAQPIDARADTAEASFEEQMWLPFANFDEGSVAEGFATGYVAYNKDYFFFAARIADATAPQGTLRFSSRDDDEFFYPELSYEIDKKTGERIEKRWPEGVRRFSYRMTPPLPSGQKTDNVQLAFNAIPAGKDGELPIPDSMPERFVTYKTTDYLFALNPVAERYGGGTEVWRLDTPGMPRKHFYPRQPKHALEGAVTDAKLVITHSGGTRIVECAIPWHEIPVVRALMQAGEPVKFSFRVNHDERSPQIDLNAGRSAARGHSRSFQPDWTTGQPNEVSFGWERP